MKDVEITEMLQEKGIENLPESKGLKDISATLNVTKYFLCRML